MTNLNPVRLGDDSAYFDIEFADNENTLHGVEMQKLEKKIIHEVQTKEDVVSKYLSHKDLGNSVWCWQNLTYKRNPRKIMQNLRPINPTPQAFDKFGMTANLYGDECWITDIIQKKANIGIQKAMLLEINYGFERLKTKQAFASMVNPVRWQTSDYHTGNARSVIRNLPYSQVAAVITLDTAAANEYAVGAAQNGIKLARFDDDIVHEILRKFTDNNVMPNMTPNALLTPGALAMIRRTKEYKNRDYIYHQVNNETKPTFMWKFINWIRCTPEVAPGPFYAGKYVGKTYQRLVGDSAPKVNVPATGVHFANITDSAADSFPLTADNHEVLPVWYTSNVYRVSDVGRDKAKILRIPYYRDEPVYLKEFACGGGRAQDVLQFNMIIPKF